MKLRRYCSIIILFIFSLVFDSLTAFASEVTEQEKCISIAETFNNSSKSEVQRRRRKKKRRRRRSRKSRKRRTRKKVDPKLIAAREKVARERLYRGGTKTIKQAFQMENFSELPLINRFKKGDKSLDGRCIRELYYSYTPIKLPRELKGQEIQKLNRAIELRSFTKALAICKQQIKFTPLNLTLLSKTCELAHHLGDESYKLYTWQLTELLYVISTSGDGLTDKTPYRLHSILDLLRFEELWLDTKRDAIVEIKIHPQEMGNLVKLFFKDKEGKRQVRYYKLV